MKFRYLIFIIILFCVSCVNNGFLLQFNLPDDVTDNYNVTYYATDVNGLGITVQAVASVMKGTCELKGVTKRPTLIYITNRKSKLPLVIFVDRGENIAISGESDNPLDWNVEGNEMNIEISKWRKENFKALSSDDIVKINDAIANYVENNPDNPAGIILLLTYFNRRKEYARFVRLFDSYRELSEKSKWMGIVGAADQLGGRLTYPAKIESMVMRSGKGGYDTILFNGKTPGILFFWQNDSKQKEELIDSIKALVKQYPDSASRIIADINLDSDSTLWRSAIRKDTIKKEKRLWVPEGLSNSNVMRLKVGTVPYYIVFDKDGNQIHRSGEIGEAMDAFRDIMKKK